MDISPLETSLRHVVAVIEKRHPRSTWPQTVEMTAGGVAVGADAALAEIDTAHGFIFDDDASWEHIEFGAELLNRGIFRMPYERTAIKFPIYVDDEGSARATPHSHVICFVHQQAGHGRPKWFIASAVRRADWREIGSPEWFLNGMASFLDRADIRDDGTIALTAAEFPLWLASGEPPGARLERMKRRFIMESRAMALSVLGLVTSLMSREVESTSVPAPFKLNAIRARKGKLPLIEHKIVRLRAVNGPTGGTHRLSGDRKPPRMHWRRGHFRNLLDGKIVPVAPAIIGSGSRGMIFKDYSVEGDR